MALLAAVADGQLVSESELAADLIQLVEPAMNVKIMLHPRRRTLSVRKVCTSREG